jgi:imidazolonepropionase
MWDLLIENVSLATMTADRPYGAVPDGAVAIRDGRIAFAGTAHELEADDARLRIDGRSGWLSPGLIDCHTHIVHGGNRSNEFEQRLQGLSYEEVARRGGGIVSTVAATRAASEDGLFASARRRLVELMEEGLTSIEIKSGYGLEPATELKMLRVARRLGRELPVDVHATFLGAHALPVEYAGRSDTYIDLVCNEMLPAVASAGLADAVDAFCERIAFSPAQTERVLRAAQRHGLPVKLHADQLSDLGGAKLVAGLGGLSADHLEHSSADSLRAMAEAGTVAVLLPGAFYFLRETQVPPVALLREHGVPIAIATDCNPGSSPVTSILLMLNMACTLFGLTPEEALAGVTRNGAKALGIAASHGTIEVGKVADVVLWEVEQPAELAYAIGANPCRLVIKAGEIVLDRRERS